MKMIKKRKSERGKVTEDETVHLAGKKQIRKGALNLVLLGVGSVIAACITTGVSLLVYHNSGDIYLDRSRPGYLPDEEETKEDGKNEDYNFEKTGKIDMKIIEEYLEKLKEEEKTVEVYNKSFGAEALSDERLGIPASEESESQE